MKSGLLDVVDFFKTRNMALKNEVENDYKEYLLLSRYYSNNMITITDSSIEVIDNGESKKTTMYDLKTIFNFMHLYFSRSMLKGTNAYRYDVFMIEDNRYKKIGYFEQDKPNNDKRMLIICPNEDIVSMIREELVANYNYIFINEPMERVLGL